MIPEQEFEAWWRINHPHDWFAKDRDGEPLSHPDRTLIWWYVKTAWLIAFKEGQKVAFEEAAVICDKRAQESKLMSYGAPEEKIAHDLMTEYYESEECAHAIRLRAAEGG